MKQRCTYILLFTLLSCVSLAQSSRELTLKGVMLEKFTRFIEWPADFSSDSVFTIGVVNYPSMEKELHKLYSDVQIKNKKVRILSLSSTEEMNDTRLHVLFFGSGAKAELNQYLKAASKSESVLLVGDGNGYAKMGLHINFYIIDNNVRFEINETAVRKSSLAISYLLFKSARIVSPVGVQ